MSSFMALANSNPVISIVKTRKDLATHTMVQYWEDTVFLSITGFSVNIFRCRERKIRSCDASISISDQLLKYIYRVHL